MATGPGQVMAVVFKKGQTGEGRFPYISDLSASALWSDTGYSAMSIPIPTATVAWPGF
jgi:hypothetical protein